MPLYRRLPKRGFNSFSQDSFSVVNVESLNGFSSGDVVTPSSLKARGLVTNFESGIKILGGGNLKKKLTVVANAFSNSALSKIQAASGECRIAKIADARKDYDSTVPIDLKITVEAKPYVPLVKAPKKAKASPEKPVKQE